ncbi:MAG: hypothetical protein K0R55_3205, partial [Sporomusa sp.]|nr:hypothetical protein [Sporomusa sp.]
MFCQQYKWDTQTAYGYIIQNAIDLKTCEKWVKALTLLIYEYNIKAVLQQMD